MKKLIVSLSIFALMFVFAVPAMATGLNGYYWETPSANSMAVAGAEADLNLTQIGAKIPIAMIPQQLLFAPLIPYFGPDNPGYRFRPLADILLYSDTFSIKALQAGISDDVLEDNGLVRVISPEALKQTMKVIYTGNGKNVKDVQYKRMGYVGAFAKDKRTSLDAFQLMMLIANKMGAKVVHATRQGVDFSMYATGYGVSLGGTTGTISDSGQSGAVSTGMLGWSTGKSGANRDPWVQGIALEPVVK